MRKRISKLCIELPLPPSSNNYKYKSSYKPNKKAIEFQEIFNEITKDCGTFEDAKVHVQLNVSFTPHGGDLDNRCKWLFDCTTYAGIWNDDKQVELIDIGRMAIEKKGFVVMIITDIETEEELKERVSKLKQARKTKNGVHYEIL